jgi:hypothetical protein
MGFVATTLSICDPVGALQRLIIKRPDPMRPLQKRILTTKTEILERGQASYVFTPLPQLRIFARHVLWGHFNSHYLIAIRNSPEDIKTDGVFSIQSLEQFDTVSFLPIRQEWEISDLLEKLK